MWELTLKTSKNWVFPFYYPPFPLFWTRVWTSSLVDRWLWHRNRYLERAILIHPSLCKAGFYRPLISFSVVSSPCWRGTACSQSFLADSRGTSDCMFHRKFVFPNLKKRKCSLVHDPGRTWVSSLHATSLLWNAELRGSAAGNLQGWRSGLLLAPRLPTTGTGGSAYNSLKSSC